MISFTWEMAKILSTTRMLAEERLPPVKGAMLRKGCHFICCLGSKWLLPGAHTNEVRPSSTPFFEVLKPTCSLS